MSAANAAATAINPDEPLSPPLAASGPVELSPQRVHELAVQAFRVGNRGRLSLCTALRTMSETRMYLELGFPSLTAYTNAFFQLRRAEAYEYVRVATALVELTELRDAFAAGELSWTVLKAITRVATVATQGRWIAFAQKHGAERTLAEVKDAARRGKDAPRKSSFGLPNLDQKLVLRFSRSDMEKIRAWLDEAGASAAEKTGEESVSVEQALLFVCEQAMAGAAPPAPSDGPKDDKSRRRAQLVFQRCPDCRRARMATQEGAVEVSADEVARYSGTAEPVVLDGPTPAWMRRQIIAREGARCGNPRCANPADHCHHIEHQADGGETSLANEIALCTTCHALVHAGLLSVETDPGGEPTLTARAERQRDGSRLGACGREAEELPVLVFANPSTPAASSASEGSEASAAADLSAVADATTERHRLEARAAQAGVNVEDLAHGLVRLGWSLRDSRERVLAAIAGLSGEDLTEPTVLRRALSRR